MLKCAAIDDDSEKKKEYSAIFSLFSNLGIDLENLKLRTPQPTTSNIPSESPSLVPSYVPSHVPIKSLSLNPTKSFRPSEYPSGVPSEVPSISQLPSNYPSGTPSESPTNEPTKRCRDRPNYRSKFKLPCRNHRKLNCEKMGVYGYSLKEVEELLNSCKESCGICDSSPPSVVPSGSPSIRPSSKPSTNPSGLPSIVPSPFPTTEYPTRYPTKLPEPSATPTHDPTPQPTPLCHDIPTWSNRLLLTCSDFANFDCNVARKLNFSEEEVRTLYVNCPVSCGTCDTGAPSLTPSNKLTLEPTKSSLPTKADTGVPTLQPTYFPTLEATLTPTHAPTQSPTYIPTLSPTYTPTLSPTNYPTNYPTEKPVDKPTIKPSSSPTVKKASKCIDSSEIFCGHWVKVDLSRCSLTWKNQSVYHHCMKTCGACL